MSFLKHLVLTLTLSTTLFAVTERQQEALSQVYSHFDTLEKEYAADPKHAEDELDDLYFFLTDINLPFIPTYDLTECTTLNQAALNQSLELIHGIFEEELGLSIDDIAATESNFSHIKLTHKKGTTYTIRFFEPEIALTYLRATQILQDLDLNYLQVPTIKGIVHIHFPGMIEAYALITIEQEGTPLHSLKDNPEKLAQACKLIGRATGELTTKSQVTGKLSPVFKNMYSDLPSNFPQEIQEKNARYASILHQNTPPLTYHLDSIFSWTTRVDLDKECVVVPTLDTFLESMDIHGTPIELPFASQLMTIDHLRDLFPHQDHLIDAFNEGYQQSGLSLPTEEEKEIYTFYKDLGDQWDDE